MPGAKFDRKKLRWSVTASSLLDVEAILAGAAKIKHIVVAASTANSVAERKRIEQRIRDTLTGHWESPSRQGKN